MEVETRRNQSIPEVMDTIDLILQQLRALATQADDIGRHRLLDGLRDIQSSLETPHDTLSHFSGLVNNQHTTSNIDRR
jgi:hypothetical protein